MLSFSVLSTGGLRLHTRVILGYQSMGDISTSCSKLPLKEGKREKEPGANPRVFFSLSNAHQVRSYLQPVASEIPVYDGVVVQQ